MLKEESVTRLLVKYLIAFFLQKILSRNNGDIFSI